MGGRLHCVFARWLGGWGLSIQGAPGYRAPVGRILTSSPLSESQADVLLPSDTGPAALASLRPVPARRSPTRNALATSSAHSEGTTTVARSRLSTKVCR